MPLFTPVRRSDDVESTTAASAHRGRVWKTPVQPSASVDVDLEALYAMPAARAAASGAHPCAVQTTPGRHDSARSSWRWSWRC